MQHEGKTLFQFALERGNQDALACLLKFKQNTSAEELNIIIDSSDTKLFAALMHSISESQSALDVFEIFFNALTRSQFAIAEYASYYIETLSRENWQQFRRFYTENYSSIAPENQEILNKLAEHFSGHFSRVAREAPLQQEKSIVGYYTSKLIRERTRFTRDDEEAYYAQSPL
jgi:hypothetical protein